VQTKKDAAVSPQAGTAPTDVMAVSGRIIFDPLGRTIRQFYPVTESLGQQGTFNPAFDSVQPTITAYDILDRATLVTAPDTTTTTIAYDFGADRFGQTRFRTTVTDANGVRKEMFRDVRTQTTTVNEFNNGGTAVFRTSYAYDPLRQITGVTDDQGNVTSVVYDLFGRRSAINNPDAGLTTFTYDLADNLTAKQTANLRATGQQVTYAYQFNRVTAINYPAFPANNVTYTYGAASQRNPGPVGNVVGRITHITDGAGTEDRLYGPLGEIVRETRAIPVQGNQVLTYTTQFQFDTFNRIHAITYPDQPNGEVVRYSYDSGGLVNGVTGSDDQLETAYAARIDYDKFGQRLLIDTGNGTRTTYAYRADNRRLASLKATLAMGYTFNDFAFTYDPVGNLKTLQNNAQFPGSFTGGNLGNAIGGPWTKAFNYDDLYRLTTSTGTHSVAPTQTYTYSFSQSYDSIHNITHKTQTAMQGPAVNPQTTYDFAYSYPAPGSAHPHGPTAIGSFAISNDADGNQTRTLGTGTSDQSQYLYDEENRMSCANKGAQAPSPSCNAQGNTSFIYDHAGVRKVKTQSSPVIYPNQYYTDFGGGAGSQFKHVFIGSERILTKKARIAPDRQHWYYHPDHLGSTAMVTNENGQLVDAVHYFPFGEVWLEERPASLPQDHFFTAKELDQETGFYDFGARYLDPRFSKWMSTDPALGSFLPGAGKPVAYRLPALANKWRGNPDLPGLGGVIAPVNLNLYGYGGQNPSTFLDPDGWETQRREFNSSGEIVREFSAGAARGIAQGWVDLLFFLGRGASCVHSEGTNCDDDTPPPELFDPPTSSYEAKGRLIGPIMTLGWGGRVRSLAALTRGCSFSEATPVTTIDGLKPIGELKIGDRVLARSEETGTYAFEPITEVFRHQDPVKLRLTLEDPSTGATEVIETTPDHSFHVPGRGFVPAGSLKPDDTISRAAAGVASVVRLMSNSGEPSEVLRVKTLTFENQPFSAYDLEVGQDHTFFVGSGRAWVHNITCLEVIKKLQERLASGRKLIRPSRTYHGRLPHDLEHDIIANPEGVYETSSGRLIFLKEGNVVVTEGRGSGAGNLVTSYGPGGPRGPSGAAALGGSATDLGLPVTHDMIVQGQIPAPSGGFLPPATPIPR